MDLNRILSGNLNDGLAVRNLTLIVGPEHSFKSSFSALTLANAQKKGFKVIIIDTEGAWTPDFISRWGLDPTECLYIYTPWIDELKMIFAQLIDGEDDRFAIVLDSIGGIEKKKIMVDALAGDPKADQGTLQKELKVLLKMILNLTKVKDSLCVATGHLYGNPSGYGDAEMIGGGKAAKLLPDTIISLKKSKIQDKEKNVIGNSLKAITLKNRMYPPFNEATIEIDFINGINKYAGLADLAVEAGLVTKGGAGWYTYITKHGEEIKAQGDEKLMKLFMDNEEEFINTLNDWLKNTGFSTVNNQIKEAISLKDEGLEKQLIEKDDEFE